MLASERAPTAKTSQLLTRRLAFTDHYIHPAYRYVIWRQRYCVAFYEKPITELLSVTCHVGSHIVTCHQRNTGKRVPP